MYILSLMKKNLLGLTKAIAFSLFAFSCLANASLTTKDQALQISKNSNESTLIETHQSHTENKKKITTEKLDLPETSNNSELLANNINKPFSDIRSLNQFAENNSALKRHNKALELLQNKNKAPAILLLKKNFYQSLFPASYFLLIQLEETISFSHILLLISFIIISLITTGLFIFYFKNPNAFYLKNLLIGLFVFLSLLASSFFTLKDRVSLLEESYLKLAPIENSPQTILLPPLEDLIVLKKQGKWLKIKSKNNQTGWIPDQQVFQLF